MNYNIMKELINIQEKLKAPKGQWNNFGKYKYRSCEDILEAVKPLLVENKCQLTISDEVVSVGNRIYVKSTARIKNEAGEEEFTIGFAREEESKKGMDGSQVTGASSSYARKYALNGMFCIDDTKDSDTTNDGEKSKKEAEKTLQTSALSKEDEEYLHMAIQEIRSATSKDVLVGVYNTYSTLHTNKQFMDALSTRKKEVLK